MVNVLDVQARRPWPRYLAYCMSKAALESTTRGQARRFAPQVRFNGVAPGIVLWNDADGAELRERLLSAVPMGRFGQPTDVAAAVRMLLENDYITGQVLNVDGGRSM
ncbi:MAG: Dihydromonapterin reductase [Phycisphaerae bacterium]|nr:Dihydromonapterin reductase [Phycisphaerae bacterium]